MNDAPPPQLCVILPASNEAAYIGPCLDALLASIVPAGLPDRIGTVEILVVANGCRDSTAAVARSRALAAAGRGWRLRVIETGTPGKLNALNLGDAAAQAPIRAYLDADVIVSPPLLAQIGAALDRPDPAWASGTAEIAPPRSMVSRAYARFWARLPFLTDGVPGFGLFAVNAAGRARWERFPDIISDDTFVRLHFAPHERIAVAASYRWPLAEGIGALVRVRRRQDAGVRELRHKHAALFVNYDTPRPGAGALGRLFLRDPFGFAVYGAVSLAVRLTAWRRRGEWTRIR